MEEIDIKEIIYFIFKKRFFVILAVIIGAMLGLFYTKFLVTPMYSSYSTVVLSQPTSSSTNIQSNSITQSDVTLNQKLVATYSEIMKSRVVATQVKQELKLNIDETELMKSISVTAKDDTEMLKIQVSNADPVLAANIANSLANVFIVKVKEIYNIENITIIDTAFINNRPYNVNYTKNIALFAASAGILACGILFLIFYFDTRIKSKSEVEELLGLDILAVIPEINS